MILSLQPEHLDKGLRGDLHPAHPLHALLPRSLLLQKLALSGDIAPIALGEHILTQSFDTLPGDDPVSNRCLKSDIEELPVEDDSVDVIISNCVINLAPDKAKVFGEAFRVLRPGGRILISDIVLEKPLPKAVRDDVKSYTGCLGGAILEKEYLQLIHDAGFEKVKVIDKAPFNLASSAKIEAYKPSQ